MLAYVLQVKVEMELEIQQCERTKAVREEQLERLTQICQEQAVSTRALTRKSASQLHALEYKEHGTRLRLRSFNSAATQNRKLPLAKYQLKIHPLLALLALWANVYHRLVVLYESVIPLLTTGGQQCSIKVSSRFIVILLTRTLTAQIQPTININKNLTFSLL